MINIRILKQEEKSLILPLLESEFSNNILDSIKYNEHLFSIGAFLDDKLVGHTFVHEVFDYLNNEKCYVIEYVVVNTLYRSKGIATAMFNYIENIAHSKGITSLMLTSKVSRVEARNFYTKFGFTGKDTGVFKKIIKEK